MGVGVVFREGGGNNIKRGVVWFGVGSGDGGCSGSCAGCLGRLDFFLCVLPFLSFSLLGGAILLLRT